MTVETSQTPSAAIDSDRWPAVAKVPRGPLAAASAAIANRLLRRTATHLPLRLVYSDGTATGAADPRAPSLFIHRQVPVHHSFAYRSYSWYVDVDNLPQLPWWLRPFARFHADDHFADPFSCPPHSSLRDRLDAFFAARGLAVPDGRITALLQARVLGYVFNPLSIFWCHDRDGQLRHVIAEVHNTYGGRHAYLLPPADLPVVTAKNFYVSPFHQLAGYYLIRAPRPDRELDVTVTLHRDRRQVCPEFTATLRGQRRPATTRQIAMMQIISPLAPMVVAARIRIQGIRLWLRRVPVVPR
nr:DUF1365 domain-containing protein [Mycobacterium tuberculosis]